METVMKDVADALAEEARVLRTGYTTDADHHLASSLERVAIRLRHYPLNMIGLPDPDGTSQV